MKNYKHGKQVLRAALALALVFCLSVVSLAAEVLDSHSPESTVTLRRKADAGSGVELGQLQEYDAGRHDAAGDHGAVGSQHL